MSEIQIRKDFSFFCSNEKIKISGNTSLEKITNALFLELENLGISQIETNTQNGSVLLYSQTTPILSIKTEKEEKESNFSVTNHFLTYNQLKTLYQRLEDERSYLASP